MVASLGGETVKAASLWISFEAVPTMAAVKYYLVSTDACPSSRWSKRLQVENWKPTFLTGHFQ